MGAGIANVNMPPEPPCSFHAGAFPSTHWWGSWALVLDYLGNRERAVLARWTQNLPAATAGSAGNQSFTGVASFQPGWGPNAMENQLENSRNAGKDIS